ncbi:hypothetical protein M0R45_006896 [Rubus argutus]|uniref:Transposase-associated domain-containing protein n=1 Tax=Rubus argutus TaxID=59490 RepID=A0AAW1YRU9_RUBAR
MDKSWVYLNRRSEEYRDAARKFVDRSRLSVGNADKIICPCIKCKSVRSFHFEVVYEHLVMKGMNPDYEAWVLHGENPSVSEECENVEMSDAYRMYKDAYDQDHGNGERGEDFLQKLEAAESPLYEGCKKYTRLTATVVLYKLKAVHGLSDVDQNSLTCHIGGDYSYVITWT